MLFSKLIRAGSIVRTLAFQEGKLLSVKCLMAVSLVLISHGFADAAEDRREFVELPDMMRHHMLSNMRDHLVALNDILLQIGAGDLDGAAQVAESRLGMSSLESHGAAHMAKFMPQAMQELGTSMHRAASRFALTAQEGEVMPTYKALADVTTACVACHASYRIR
jgi:hypothetical protein